MNGLVLKPKHNIMNLIPRYTLEPPWNGWFCHYENLQNKGYNNIVTRTSKELDLRNQQGVS